ncbi:MAG: winged helix-turn-helix transcriptional regulator [Oceanococcus sp.]
MSRKKPYEDGCATAHALDLIGERWAMLIVRELIPGPKRFSDIKAALPGISSNILTNRLHDLEAGHVLIRDQLPPPAASQIYRLTHWGAELEPLIKAIGAWAAKSPELSPGKPMSAASVMLSFRTMFSAEQARGVHMSLALTLDRIPHRAAVDDSEFKIELGVAETPDVSVSGDPNLLAGIVYGGMSIESAEKSGLTINGSRESLAKFSTLFPLPEKAKVTASKVS